MKNKNDVVAVVFVPSADCGKDAQREAFNFADMIKERLQLKTILVERQLAFDLFPEFTESEADEFVLRYVEEELGKM